MRAKLRKRLQCAEETIQQLKKQASAAERTAAAVSIEDRVCILRRVRSQVDSRFHPGEIPDPFPQLEGDAYLLAFWPWYLANGVEHWPAWAQGITERTCYSVSPERQVRCLRELWAHVGVPDPFPSLEGQRYLCAWRRARPEERPGRSPSRARRR